MIMPQSEFADLTNESNLVLQLFDKDYTNGFETTHVRLEFAGIFHISLMNQFCYKTLSQIRSKQNIIQAFELRIVD